MATLARRLFQLSLPFLIAAAGVLWLDPFRFFNLRARSLESLRLHTAMPLNSCIWKLRDFSGKVTPNLLLGDSRIDNLPVDDFSRALGEPAYNLAFGAATLNEMSDAYWYAVKKGPVRRLWIGVSFNQFSDYARTYRTEDYRSLEEDPFLYFTNRTVLKAAAYMAYFSVTGKNEPLDRVTMPQSEFWAYVLGPLTQTAYSRYAEPVRFRKDLRAIVRNCRRQNTQVRFVIAPTHADLQRRIASFHLGDQYAEFKRFLASLAETYDYDFPNEMTDNRANFRDPMHTNHEISRQIAKEIATGNLKLGRRLIPPDSAKAVDVDVLPVGTEGN